MRQPLIAGNWKMNGSSASIAELLAGITAGIGAIRHAEVAVCPPFPYLHAVGQAIAGTAIKLGAQNVCTEEGGAYTGEVAASMLIDMGCHYVIVGHSERRQYYGETSAIVAEKHLRAQAGGLTPILCVGETIEQRENGDTESVVAEQLDAVLELAGIAAFDNAVVAYEPVWAIGTGHTATPEQAQQVHAFIRSKLAESNADTAARLRLLYGGSMKAANAADLIAQTDIDGGLIGGASLKHGDFLAICSAAETSDR